MNYHPCTFILIKGLKDAPNGRAVLAKWDEERAKIDAARTDDNEPSYRSMNVKIQRLQKKIEKLKKQRDFHEERHKYYAKVLSLQPYLERRYESYTERIEREKLNKQNAKTVKEQSLLIEMLRKENEQLRKNSIDAPTM